MKRFFGILSITLVALTLSACGGGGGGSNSGAPSTQSNSAPLQAHLAVQEAVTADIPYDVTLLGALDGDSYAVAVNDNGQVVGNYTDHNGRVNAVLWEEGTPRVVVAGGQASRVNNLGQVIGCMDPYGYPEAFVYEGTNQVFRLNSIGGSSQALALNDQGEIAGRITDGGEYAFLDQDGTQRFIATEVEGYAIAMNNTGQVLIKRLAADGSFHTLLWQAGTLTDIGTLGGQSTQGRDINDAGQVVGWSQTADGQTHACLWEKGVMTDLASLAGEFSAAVAINNQGQILLKSSDATQNRNLLYTNGQVLDLGNLGATYAVANDLNNRGDIVGLMSTASGEIRAFLATPAAGDSN